MTPRRRDRAGEHDGDRGRDPDRPDDDGPRGAAARPADQRLRVEEPDGLLGRHALEEVADVLIGHVVTSGMWRRVSSPRAMSERTVAGRQRSRSAISDSWRSS